MAAPHLPPYRFKIVEEPMNLDVSSNTEARLVAAARAEGISVESLVELLMDDWEEMSSVAERAAGRSPLLSADELRAKIERGVSQSESGDLIDGEEFARQLIAELDHKRPA